jgi:hypothetical protein
VIAPAEMVSDLAAMNALHKLPFVSVVIRFTTNIIHIDFIKDIAPGIYPA